MNASLITLTCSAHTHTTLVVRPPPPEHPGKINFVAKTLGRSPSAVRGAVASQSLVPANHGGYRGDSLGADGMLVLAKLFTTFPKMPQWWFARAMTFVMQRPISTSTIARKERELALSRKVTTTVYSESLTDVVFQKQEEFMAAVGRRKAAQPRYLDRAIFVDVVSFNQKDMHGGKGLSPIGTPFLDAVPSDRTTTGQGGFGQHVDVCSAVNRVSGVMALAVWEGHSNAAIILNYFKYVLLPECCPGDDVYIDGASYWGGNSDLIRDAMRPMFRAAGVNVYWLPSRSPLFNPDEFFNGWLKGQVQRDVILGRANPFEPAAGIINAVERNQAALTQMCEKWVKRVYGD